MQTRVTTCIVTGLLIAMATMGALLFMAGAPGCVGPVRGLRLAPNEEQKTNRDAAHRIARGVQEHGLPPATPAGSALVDSTLDAMIEAGRPKDPIALEHLIPPGTADAWRTRTQQVNAYRSKTGLLLKGVKGLVDRLTGLAGDVSAAPGSIGVAHVVRRLQDIAAGAGASIELAASIEVPDSPAVSDAEQAAAEAVAGCLRDIGQAAAAAAARPVTGTDIAERVVDEADFWHGQLAPILAGFGIAIPGVGLAIKKGRDVLNARREYEGAMSTLGESGAQISSLTASLERTERSGGQIVNQAQAFMDGPIGQQPITVGDQTLTVAEMFKAFLSGQDTETQAFVNAAKRG